MSQDFDFDIRVNEYLEHIRTNYVNWGKPDMSDSIKERVRQEMIENFNQRLGVERGSKYLKVVSNGGVHSFIVIKPDAKFKYGDILKAASWAAPARNFARGNIFSGNFSHATWTGVA